MRLVLLLLCFLGAALARSQDAAAPDPGPRIRGASSGNWWILGETVVFRPQGPCAFPLVTGVVRDSRGAEAARVAVSGADFSRLGWKWKPERPGFYEVEFVAADESGKSRALGESFTAESFAISPKDGTSQPLPPLRSERRKHAFAVIASPNRPPAQVPPLFGISLNTRADQPYDIAAKVGFHFIRVHPIAWYLLEPEEGKYEWSTLDLAMEGARKNGFGDFVGNVFGTPKWASTASEDVKKAMQWKNRYSAYMPRDLGAWTRFLEAVARRYPQIRTWELWNEPHFPGQSIFWMDSPENFVRLLSAGYGKLKELDPGYAVCVGGMGMRYLGFYDRIVQLGAGKSFDVLALHGQGASAAPFSAIDRRYGIPAKPWITTEWHGILVKSGDAEFPTEPQLAARMLGDLMPQIREGVEGAALFTLVNVPGGEAELLKQLGEQGANRQTVSGLFRCRPYFEPRLAAVVYRNFADCFSGKIRARGTYAFPSAQIADWLESDAGAVLVVRTTGAAPEPAARQLLDALGEGSRLVDWEGNPPMPGKDGRPLLEPGVFYYLKAPAPAVVQAWKQADPSVLRGAGRKVELDERFLGAYGSGPGPQPRWLEAADPARGFSARVSVDLGAEGLDLVAEVAGPAHVQESSTMEMSKGDSVEFALDAAGNGRWADAIVFRAALTKSGPVLWKAAAPAMEGDWPARYSYPGTPVEFGAIQAEQGPQGVRYRIHVDKDDLYPFDFAAGQRMRFAWLAKRDDGQGGAVRIEWGHGLADPRDATLFGTLFPSGDLVLAQPDLRPPRQYGTVENPAEEGALRVRSGAGKGQGASVSTDPAPVKPGETLEVRFQARGDVTLKAFAVVAGGEASPGRVSLGSGTSLAPGAWTPVSARFVVPPGATTARINLLCWEQAGLFEVRAFRVLRVPGANPSVP